MRFGEQARQRKRAVRRADDAHALDRIAGNESRQLFVEAQLALGLAEQMHGRREAAGDQHAIRRDALAADRHRLDAAHAVHGIDRRAGPHLDAGGCCGSSSRMSATSTFAPACCSAAATA